MSAIAVPRGRVLVIGASAACDALVEQLSTRGYRCATAESASAIKDLAGTLRPEAILVSGGARRAAEALAVIREDDHLRALPVVADVGRASADTARRLGVEDWVHSPEELVPRLEAALRARRLVERDEKNRLRMEMLLDITQAATSSLELDEILRLAVDKVSRVIDAGRCSVVLVEGVHTRSAQVVATRESPHASPMDLDLARYPELRRALETRQPVHVEEASRDPLMAEVRATIEPLGVRSILVQPLISQDEAMGALFLRLSRTDDGFGREEREFVQAVAAALANSIRNARLHTALKRKREDLESAYVDRYRELSDANRRLKELNRLKDEIIAVVSHDVRAPLQILLGHGRLLMDGGLQPQQRVSAEAMVRQGKKILSLVESLLEKGKGEAARLSLEPRLLDVAELCRESARELEILAAEKGVNLRSEAPESLKAIGDEVKLHEVLQNLITNAIHHAKDAGEVVVRAQRLARPDGDAARVVVQDDGVGIPADQLHLVFDRYRHGGSGTGLGLAICKEFVELHGGEIWAEASPEGGAAFVFTLPLADERGADVLAQQAVPPLPGPREEQARVLVVEDEPEIAAVLAEVLRSRYRVDVARDGAEGLAKARATHPDLVVMDVFLPKLDGLDAAVALKASTDTRDIPVILLSAHQGVAEKVRALNLGAVDYMSKPFQALELLSRTERALQLKRTQQELERTAGFLRTQGTDALTGLHDHRGLLTRLDQELSRARRYGRPLTLAILRPERPVTQTLRAVTEVLRQRLRSPDVLAHLGGGTFGVVLPECPPDAGRAAVVRLAPDLQEAAGAVYQTAVADLSQDTDPVEAILERLGAAAPASG